MRNDVHESNDGSRTKRQKKKEKENRIGLKNAYETFGVSINAICVVLLPFKHTHSYTEMNGRKARREQQRQQP